jgi:hypothetical protein
MNVSQDKRIIHGDPDRFVFLIHLLDLMPFKRLFQFRCEEAVRQVFGVDGLVVCVGEDHREIHGANHFVKEETQVSRGRAVARDVLIGLRVEINDLPFAGK